MCCDVGAPETPGSKISALSAFLRTREATQGMGVWHRIFCVLLAGIGGASAALGEGAVALRGRGGGGQLPQEGGRVVAGCYKRERLLQEGGAVVTVAAISGWCAYAIYAHT